MKELPKKSGFNFHQGCTSYMGSRMFFVALYSARKKKATTMILYGVKGYRTIHFSFLLFSCKAQYYFSTNTRELKKS